MGEQRRHDEPDASEESTEGPASDDDVGADAEIWDELPTETEYPLRPGEDEGTAGSRREAWRKRSATGAILTGFAFGLREVLEPDRNEPAIVLETSGIPPKDLPVEADLDEVPPKQSVVRIRPWLLSRGGAAPVDDETPDAGNPAPADDGES